MVPSRSAARRALEERRVVVAGVPEPRPSTLVPTDVAIDLHDPQRFVSRGGDKLDTALQELSVRVEGRSWLDAGASTGGFTDRLLQGGASAVVAVDVGYGQFDWRLRNDPKVTLLERTNVRNLKASDLPFVPQGVVADLSFISLTAVIAVLAEVTAPDADLLLLVKPQFEVGKGVVGRKGVVRDPDLWRQALERVVHAGSAVSLGLLAACLADPPGPAGNREFFVHMRKGEDSDMGLLDNALQSARP